MKTFFSLISNARGSAVLNTAIGVSLLMMGSAAVTKMTEESGKQVTMMEFRIQTDMFKRQTISRIMNVPNGCRCMMRGVKYNMSGEGSSNGMSTLKRLGAFSSDCSTIPKPFLEEDFNASGVKVKEVKLSRARMESGKYFGDLNITLETKKSVSGSSTRMFTLPLQMNMAGPDNEKTVTSCSLVRNAEDGAGANLFNTVPYGTPGSVVPLSSPNGSLDFSVIPPTATGIIVQYMIGSPANKRGDRNCDIMGSDISLKIGNDCKGDGGQRFVAGTQYIPLDGCSTAMRFSCRNKSNRGEFRVLAYIDTGTAPVCNDSQFDCGSGMESDGMGSCVAASADPAQCGTGMKFDEASDSCLFDFSGLLGMFSSRYAFLGAAAKAAAAAKAKAAAEEAARIAAEAEAARIAAEIEAARLAEERRLAELNRDTNPGTCTKTLNYGQETRGCYLINPDKATCTVRCPAVRCFVPGTQVTLENGKTKNIEDILVGERVKTFDELKQRINFSPVVSVAHHKAQMNTLYTFTFSDGKTVTSNDAHRFYVLDQYNYVSADEIYKSFAFGQTTTLLTQDGQMVTIKDIKISQKVTPLFNIHVRGAYDRDGEENEYNHNYFANGILVHNIKNRYELEQ